jgi:hypothetical protein
MLLFRIVLWFSFNSNYKIFFFISFQIIAPHLGYTQECILFKINTTKSIYKYEAWNYRGQSGYRILS